MSDALLNPITLQAATWVEFSLVTFFWRNKRKLLANGEKVVSLIRYCGHAHKHFGAAGMPVLRSKQHPAAITKQRY
ncbi:hypothetical protein LMJ53_09600 [Rheinheimera sp. UJ51]|uniref:hypothetical protein n=1 Tax=Rheinheimera sp. UJ51 TaxID=2892446 RepID=UPI001E2EAF2B|nr:hypothetical protein [Rheinheimera sp. UJ51]MCC5451976.1 hypothetical protein [Rheinheimera sp. UJ51]